MMSRPDLPEVPTPGWCTISEAELLSMGALHGGADADGAAHGGGAARISEDRMEDDVVYVRRHNALAAEERARLGYSMKKISGSSKGSTPKARKTRGSNPKTQEAVYPTSEECYHLVEDAKLRYIADASPSDTEQQALRRNLSLFTAPLEAFSEIEAVLKAQMAKIKTSLATRKSRLADNSTRGRGSSLSSRRNHRQNGPSAADNDEDKITENPSKRPKVNLVTTNFLRASGRTMPEALTKPKEAEQRPLDVALLELSMARLETIATLMTEKSSSLYRAMEDLLKQADWDVPAAKSFVTMKKHFQEASNCSAAPNGRNRGDGRLWKMIQANIDANAYPIAANAFWLSENYRLDGCDAGKDWKSKVCGKRKSRPQEQKKEQPKDKDGDDKVNGTISSHGFTLPLYSLGSDDEDEDGKEPAVLNPLTQQCWPQIVRRLVRRRRRRRLRKKATKDDDYDEDFLSLMDVSDVDINISIQAPHSVPTSLREPDDDGLQIHEDDRIHLLKPVPEPPAPAPPASARLPLPEQPTPDTPPPHPPQQLTLTSSRPPPNLPGRSTPIPSHPANRRTPPPVSPYKPRAPTRSRSPPRGRPLSPIPAVLTHRPALLSSSPSPPSALPPQQQAPTSNEYEITREVEFEDDELSELDLPPPEGVDAMSSTPPNGDIIICGVNLGSDPTKQPREAAAQEPETRTVVNSAAPGVQVEYEVETYGPAEEDEQTRGQSVEQGREQCQNPFQALERPRNSEYDRVNQEVDEQIRKLGYGKGSEQMSEQGQEPMDGRADEQEDDDVEFTFSNANTASDTRANENSASAREADGRPDQSTADDEDLDFTFTSDPNGHVERMEAEVAVVEEEPAEEIAPAEQQAVLGAPLMCEEILDGNETDVMEPDSPAEEAVPNGVAPASGAA